MPARAPAPHQALDRRPAEDAASAWCACKYGVDEDVCTGDHACIRLSGCPTLTVKDNPDPLKVDPVATVIDGCVGCGLCGENAHAATLCPSLLPRRGGAEPEVARAPARTRCAARVVRAAAGRA